MTSTLHLGPLHLSLFGLCAAVGLMAALWLSQIGARLVRLDPVKVWDVAFAMILAAFIISRLLLVAGSWRSFLAAPWLVLTLPSLNSTGLLLTVLFTVAYLRWKHLSLLSFLDAMAPCFALVWAFLSLGEFAAGTRDGMPTETLLGIRNGGFGRVHPVEFYTAVFATLLCGLLIRRLSHRPVAGLGFGLGLVLAGPAIFLLDFLRVPSALFAAAILDPAQWLGLAMLIAGGALWIALPVTTREPAPEI